MVRKVLFFIIFCSGLWGMGFSAMGNVSTSLGGTGVALRNSAWGLYYNPALLASDPRSKFSFSAGLWISKNDINPLLEIKTSATLDEINKIFASLKNPRINLTTQMGVVAQIGGFHYQKDVALPDEFGRLVTQKIEKHLSAFAIGAFAASQTYFAVKNNGNGSYVAEGFGVALMEIPVAYAYQLATSFGDFNFGLAFKYMRAVFDITSFGGDIYGGFEPKIPNFLQMNPAQSFGMDLGFLYSIANFHFGLTAKNINLPSFQHKRGKISLNPSLRMGLSYEFLDYYAVTMDADLLSQSFSILPKNHYVGLGFMGDYNFVDFRVGFGMDVFNFGDSKLTAGFNVFGILDIVGEMGFNFAKKDSSKLAEPTNFGVKIGSTFAF